VSSGLAVVSPYTYGSGGAGGGCFGWCWRFARLPVTERPYLGWEACVFT